MLKKVKIFLIISFVGYLSFVIFMSIGLYHEDFKSNLSELRSSEEYKSSSKIDKVVLIRNNFENTLNDKIFNKTFYIDIYGLFQKLLCKKIVSDYDSSRKVVKMKNGNLTFVYPNYDITNYSKKVVNLYNYASDNGIYMAYINIPWRVHDNSDLPFYVTDNVTNTNNKMLYKMKNANVNIIDLEKELSGDYNTWFFKTDHHWKIETGFEAYQIITKDLDNHLGLDVPDNYLTDYNKKVYKNIFLGTYGKRVGKYYGGLDDFAYITPNFDTKFEVTNYRNVGEVESCKKGDFVETMTYPEFLTYNLDRDMSTYYTYSKGTKSEIIVLNKNAYNDKKLLILKDSFADCVYPFLSINFEETRVLDIRRYKNIRLYRYIRKYKPDAILFLQNAQSLYDETLIQWKEE